MLLPILSLTLSALIASVQGQATCTASSPQCCWVVRSWQLMGQNTTVSSSSSTDCCSMAGVLCSASKVIAINWNYKGLFGSIPADIGNLKDLTDLQLFMNSLSGKIPSSIENLVNLNRLNLGFNQLSEGIPKEIWDLKNLRWLVLEQNQLSGSISPSIGNLVNLEYLYLQNNQLTGEIPFEIGNLINLIVLDFSFNQLSGFIPLSIQYLTHLTYLGLSNNMLSGPLPDDLGALSLLVVLSISFNQLNGSIPLTLENLKNLQSIDLRSNQFTGSIPSYFENMTNLQNIYLDNNQFTGSVPDVKAANYVSFHNNQNLSSTFTPSCLTNFDAANTGIAYNGCRASSVSGRYIRLDYNRIDCLNLGEIFVYSEKGGPNIITPLTLVSKSDGWNGDKYPGKNFVDGIGSTFVHTSCDGVPWIEVDLGNTTNIYKIIIWNRNDCCQDRILGSRISILNEDHAPIYVSAPIATTNRVYTWLPSLPVALLDLPDDSKLPPSNSGPSFNLLQLNSSLASSAAERVFVPSNYSLSFNIYPFGSVSSSSNILHYTHNGGDSGRIPAIWFIGNTLRLDIRFSTSQSSNEGLTMLNPLPANATTAVRIEAVGKVVTVYLNDTLQTSGILSGNRISGNAYLFSGDPWNPPAYAFLSSITMQSIN